MPQEERDHTIHDVLAAVSDEMQHRHFIQALEEFHVHKAQDNLVLVEYPHLSGWSEVDLNLCANDLLQLHEHVDHVNIFVNNHPIHIVDLGLDHHEASWEHGDHHFNHHGEHEGIEEGALSGERLLEHHDWMDHHQLWHKTTGSYEEQIKEVEGHIHEFDETLHEIHEESEHRVTKYHDDYKAIEDEYHHRLEELEREFLERFTEVEHHYEEDIHAMQDHYDEVYYHKEEAEHELEHLHEAISQHAEL